jgi:uncharacterized membrane protein YfcA
MPEDVVVCLWLGLAALAAGAVNAIAGGGTLLTFPALLTAVTPVVANGTSTVALVPGSLAGAWGFRREVQAVRRWLPLLAVPSLAGGLVGSLLVTRLDPSYFDALVPWLILTAALLFLFQPLLARSAGAGGPPGASPWAVAGVVFFQLGVAVYGGYFGAGIGILMLSALGLMGLRDIHAMNGLKNFLAVCINGVSVAVFVLDGVVAWRYVAVMTPAAVLGAYVGARSARRLDRRLVRWVVVAIGFALAGHFFYQRWNGG